MDVKRPSQQEYFMNLAIAAGSRSNCASRKVGCILVDKHNNILSTGYNGVPKKVPHCTADGCPRLGMASGEALDKCLAVHAEMNALMACQNIRKIHTAYVSVSPCLTCTVMLLNTGCKKIVFEEFYDEKIVKFWENQGRRWTCTGADVSDTIGLDFTD